MPIMRMRNVGATGVNTDIPPYNLTPTDWSWANNVRFNAGVLSKMGGYEPALLENMPNEIPTHLVKRPKSDGLIYGSWVPEKDEGSLYLAEGNSHINVSRLENDVRVRYNINPNTPWNYTTLSNAVVFTSLLENPQGLLPGSTAFINLPGWGKPNKDFKDSEGNEVITPTVTWKTSVIRAYKTYLLCLGIVEDGVEYPQRVRWSASSDINNLPPNWHQDDINNDGGFNDLMDSTSYILDGSTLRDSFIIYTNRDTYIMDYVGGTMVFNFRKLFSDSGILAAGCVTEFEGQHFVLSEDDVFIHNGSTRKSIATGRIKNFLLKELSTTNFKATRVYSYPFRKEIWITYVSSSGTGSGVDVPLEDQWACDKAAVWSWEYDTWSFMDLPRVYDIGFSTSPDLDKRTWELNNPKDDPDSWDSPDNAGETWNMYYQTFSRQQIFGCSVDKCIYKLDLGFTTKTYDSDDGGSITTRPVYAEVIRSALDFDEQQEDISYHKWWRTVYPQMNGNGSVRFYIGGSDKPNGNPYWDSWQDFSIENDYRVDCFSNYRYPALRIVDGTEGDWNMVGYDVDYFVEGNR